MRSARRPAGWIAPGPLPEVPAERGALGPLAGEDLCFLSGDWRILQRIEGHRWSLDDLITAWVAADCASQSRTQQILDLGCGIGSVLLMLAWRFPHATLVGMEAQEVSVDLARRSVAWNGINNRCTVRHADLRDPAGAGELPRFDLVSGTPPYFPFGTAVPSEHAQCGPCLFEERGGIEDYCLAAARVLSSEGLFVVCASVQQRARVAPGARRAGLRITRTLEVVPRAGKAPLLDVYVMQHSSVGATLPQESSVIVRDQHGQWTEAFAAVRRDMGLPPPLPRTSRRSDSA